MISIIICNRKKVLDPKLENNIKSTIGIEYEIINIDNSDNRYNIFQAYNKGIQNPNIHIFALCMMIFYTIL